MYINNFTSVSSKLYYVLFVDDTNVFISENNFGKTQIECTYQNIKF